MAFALGPGLYLIDPRQIGCDAALACHHGMIGNGPAIEIREPRRDQCPDRPIRTNAGLGKEFGGRNPRLEDIGVPQGFGER